VEHTLVALSNAHSAFALQFLLRKPAQKSLAPGGAGARVVAVTDAAEQTLVSLSNEHAGVALQFLLRKSAHTSVAATAEHAFVTLSYSHSVFALQFLLRRFAQTLSVEPGVVAAAAVVGACLLLHVLSILLKRQALLPRQSALENVAQFCPIVLPVTPRRRARTSISVDRMLRCC
jgi:hypothetical protein